MEDLKKTQHYILYVNAHFRCGENYVGEYCQDDNPCRPDAHFCENNGTCRIITTADGFKGRCDCRLGKSWRRFISLSFNKLNYFGHQSGLSLFE